MTSTNTNALSTDEGRLFRNPLDPPIHYIAQRFGGKKAKELERFIKFAIVGGCGAIIDLGMVYVLQATIIPPTSHFSVAFVTALAFFTAVLSNFTWTRIWVYPESRSRAIHKQLVLFAFISIIGGVSRTIWIVLAHEPVGAVAMPVALPFIQLFRPGYIPGPFAAGKLGTLLSQMMGMVIVMLWNFFANRHWTYNDVE
jgi:putative flippase GtrA